MKLLIIGLDCADPRLLFGWIDELPNLKKLMANGAYGSLLSTQPPITVPAWAVMMSGKDPGQLGYYGFRNRKDYSYGGYGIANANAVKEDRVWDILSKAGKKVVLLGVPQTYPPKPVNGVRITKDMYEAKLRQYDSELNKIVDKLKRVGETDKDFYITAD
jgi:predicted AlkP superfamily phosphohydrolase/phosphomutase